MLRQLGLADDTQEDKALREQHPILKLLRPPVPSTSDSLSRLTEGMLVEVWHARDGWQLSSRCREGQAISRGVGRRTAAVAAAAAAAIAVGCRSRRRHRIKQEGREWRRRVLLCSNHCSDGWHLR